jgi:hypothetical protein
MITRRAQRNTNWKSVWKKLFQTHIGQILQFFCLTMQYTKGAGQKESSGWFSPVIPTNTDEINNPGFRSGPQNTENNRDHTGPVSTGNLRNNGGHKANLLKILVDYETAENKFFL